MSESPHPSAARLRSCEAFQRIPFRPVPVKARHDGWTPQRQRDFIDRLALCGTVARAARAVGMSPQSARKLRDHAGAASFRRAWDRALASGQSYMIDVAMARSLVGERVPIMRKGVCVAERLRYDNRLAMVALNALDRRAATRSDSRELLERLLESIGKAAEQAAD
jgi:hypothetical protein